MIKRKPKAPVFTFRKRKAEAPKVDTGEKSWSRQIDEIINRIKKGDER